VDRPLPQLAELDDDELAAAYAPPQAPWLRLNFVSTVDGAARGPDGVSKSINDAADGRVFAMLRARADVLVVGAGTIRDEGYRPNAKPIVVVTRSGDVPPSLHEGDLSQVHLATGRSADLGEARELLGDRVLVLGDDGPSPRALRDALVSLGFAQILCEGGPSLARDLLAADVVDELCLTTVPRLIGGGELGILGGEAIDVRLRLGGLLEQDGTLLARWLVDRS
jgi:riboflavin biosynthesis pyrimidine reductase